MYFNDPTVLANAITANGTYPVTGGYDFGSPQRTLTFEKIVTGGPTTLSVTYEGSLNGTTWFPLAAADTATTTAPTFIVDRPVRRVRITVASLSGGTSPTVTVNVMSAG